MESDPLKAWLAKYTPVERQILAAREKRLANATRRRAAKVKCFGDLCEATEGLTVAWRRKGTPLAEQLDWAGNDVFTLACLARYNRLQGIPLTCLAHHRRQCAGRALDRLRHRLKRPLYYAAENARRRALAAERRRITHRTTVNPCPTREEILDAWTRRRASPADAIRFGSLLEDLECYLDNSLRRDEGGNIVGRNGGIKRWLQTEIPALYLCYTTVMRYKAAARKLRQIANVRDQVPAAWIVSNSPAAWRESDSPATSSVSNSPAIETKERRAHTLWRELIADIAPTATALMEQLDALLDPQCADGLMRPCQVLGERRDYGADDFYVLGVQPLITTASPHPQASYRAHGAVKRNNWSAGTK